MSRNSVSNRKPARRDTSSSHILNKYLNTTYALTHDRNFENFLYKIGVAKETRRRAINLKPTIRLTRKGGGYTLTTAFEDGKVSKIPFELDKPLVKKLKNGGEASYIFTIKDGKLEESVTTNERKITVTRAFTPNNIIVTMMSETERCGRFYKKVSKPDRDDIKSETSRRTFTTSETSDTTGERFATESEIEIRNIV